MLLSHSPTAYLSLYPYARARWGLQCPVYATQPTVEMGRVVCLAEVLSWRSEHPIEEDLPGPAETVGEANGETDPVPSSKGKEPLRGPFVPTIEEIHEAFDWVKATRYNQPLHLGGKSRILFVAVAADRLYRRSLTPAPHAFPIWSHSRRNTVQASFTDIRYRPLCCRDQSYLGAPFRRYGRRARRHIRLLGRSHTS